MNRKTVFVTAITAFVSAAMGAALIALFLAPPQSALAFSSKPAAAAGAPTVMTYQGYLTDAGGDPLDGSVNLVFTIYPTQASSTVEWTETHNGVSVEDGYFTVLLGETTALDVNVFSGTERWLKVTVNGTDMPRQRIASTPYALQAQDGVPAGAIMLWSGSIGSIPDGWALCDGSSGTPDLRDRFIAGAGSSYSVGDTGGSATMAHTHSINHDHAAFASANESFYSAGSWSSSNRVGEGDQRHTHSIDVPNFTGTSGPASETENRPPYYALAYIMKLP